MSTLTVTKRQRHGIVASALALLATVVISISAFGGSSLISSDSDLPTASFELFNGGDTAFADFAGKPLVINFWASWCPACVGELPDIQAVHEQFGDDVTILGMANADQRDAALTLANEVGLTYTLGDDPAGELFRSLDLFAMPSTIFVSADGQIQEVFGGQLNESALVDRISNLIETS